MPVGVSSPKYGVTHKRVGVFQNNPLTDVSSAIKRNDQYSWWENYFGNEIAKKLTWE